MSRRPDRARPADSAPRILPDASPGLPRRGTARDVAFHVIRAVHDSDAYANLLLPTTISRAGLTTADAALATELTYGTLRRQGTYDAIIAVAADRPIDSIDGEVLDVLRLGTHQLLATRIASHAAVNESVTLARRERGQSSAGFVNAVLRRISRETPGYWHDAISHAARSDDERLGITSSHPVWIVRAFRRALAAEGRSDELDDLLAADNDAPGVTMAALPGVAEIPRDKDGTSYSPIGFRLGGGDPEALVRKSNGTTRVQDEGSQLVALALSRLFPVAEGERWLDLCAGPGGKTAVLAAEAMAHGAALEANEVIPARAGLVARAISGVPTAVPIHEQDGRTFASDHPDTYTRILVDAPCTGLGALRRRPEARWRKTSADVADLVDLQSELLDAALRAAAPGGVVAYVTCSPHLAETTGVLADVRRTWGDNIEELNARDALNAVSLHPLDLPTPLDGSGRAQLWPHRHGTDAMFLTLLRKRTSDGQ